MKQETRIKFYIHIHFEAPIYDLVLLRRNAVNVFAFIHLRETSFFYIFLNSQMTTYMKPFFFNFGDFRKGILYILNHDFRFFASRNVTKIFRSIHFGLITLMY